MYPIHHIFTKTCFTIGYRFTHQDITTDKNTKFKTLNFGKDYWYADPVPYKYQNEFFVFMEVFDVKKGYAGIGFSKIVDGEFTAPRIIIDESYHMSFPCVFEHCGKIYMIPETIAKNNLQVYECLDFPYKWAKAYNLAENVSCYDTAVFRYEGTYYAFSSEPTDDIYGSILYLLKLAGDENLTVEQKKEITNDYEVSRQAGNLIFLGKDLFRVAQDCSKMQYGRALIFNKIEKMDINDYRETRVERIAPPDIKAQKRWFWELAGIHSYGKVDDFEVVDFKICIFSLSTAVIKIGLTFEYLYSKIRGKTAKPGG